eukprot:TRINITY_DN44461_c0_g1_i1.p1 TRINITY_DN44461_c0_g1~~TRINITY_DN44461_c0_g1_i1.p1  ORF type:complete len:401 (+),score=31.71 TRINITY_DN44461_c0_g1_i1:90-1205(+)
MPASYGSTNTSDKTDLQERIWDWESRGQPWRLLLNTFVTVGRQFLAISLVAWQASGPHEELMSCDRKLIGLGAAVACEYSKAYVRGFPLLAMVISLLVASRTFLFLHFVYMSLKRDVLILFPQYEPYRDRLFLILAWCASQALIHFILNMTYHHEIVVNVRDPAERERLRDSINRLSVFYLVPSALFFVLLYSSYDLNDVGLPFSKYFEDHPEDSMEKVKRLRIIPEVIAMNAMQRSFHGEKTVGTADEAFDEFVTRALKHKSGGVDRTIQLSEWRIISTWWPARFVLDHRFRDPESIHFRCLWYAFSVLISCVLIFVLILCASMLVLKVQEICQGTTEGIVGFVMLVFIDAFILQFSYEFSRKTIFRPWL